jgi:Arc/MetJ-type ribon-helix-helix transcriptional regulator
MAKVNVYIPDDLLEQVDADAALGDRSRSSVVQEALAEYLTESRKEKRDRERREDMGKALEILDRIHAMPPGPTDIPDITGSEFIRGLRDADDDATDDEIIELIRTRRPKGGHYVG